MIEQLDNLVRIGGLKREPHNRHERRNLAEYEGDLDADERLLEELLAAYDALLASLAP